MRSAAAKHDFKHKDLQAIRSETKDALSDFF